MVAVPSLQLDKIEVVCPVCGEIYWRRVEVECAGSSIWGQAGYPIIICEGCRKDIYKFKEGYFSGIRIGT